MSEQPEPKFWTLPCPVCKQEYDRRESFVRYLMWPTPLTRFPVDVYYHADGTKHEHEQRQMAITD